MVYLLPLSENTNKALMIMGRNFSLNRIKRHFKSVYFIKYINGICRSCLFYDPLMFLECLNDIFYLTDTHAFASFYTLNDI